MNTLEPGHIVAGKYEVERVLGQGGMGIVISAVHVQLRERVAIKLLSKEAGHSGTRLERRCRWRRLGRLNAGL